MHSYMHTNSDCQMLQLCMQPSNQLDQHLEALAHLYQGTLFMRTLVRRSSPLKKQLNLVHLPGGRCWMGLSGWHCTRLRAFKEITPHSRLMAHCRLACLSSRHPPTVFFDRLVAKIGLHDAEFWLSCLSVTAHLLHSFDRERHGGNPGLFCVCYAALVCFRNGAVVGRTGLHTFGPLEEVFEELVSELCLPQLPVLLQCS